MHDIVTFFPFSAPFWGPKRLFFDIFGGAPKKCRKSPKTAFWGAQNPVFGHFPIFTLGAIRCPFVSKMAPLRGGRFPENAENRIFRPFCPKKASFSRKTGDLHFRQVGNGAKNYKNKVFFTFFLLLILPQNAVFCFFEKLQPLTRRASSPKSIKIAKIGYFEK